MWRSSLGLTSLKPSLGGAGSVATDDVTAEEKQVLLQRRLSELRLNFTSVHKQLLSQCSASYLATSDVNGDLTEYSGLGTVQLDSVVKAVGHTHFALMQAFHRQDQSYSSNLLIFKNLFAENLSL
jgi:hypothetical protein